MRDHYMNTREPGHTCELIVEGAMKGAIVHSYFHTPMAALQTIAFLPANTEWRVVRLPPLVEAKES